MSLKKTVKILCSDPVSVTAQVPQGLTATYQWFKDGQSLGAPTTSPTLSLMNVDYRNAASYIVRVGTLSGCSFTLDSAPARLHVKGSPPSISQGLGAEKTLPPGQLATFSATASAGLNYGETPIYYQWQFNGEPINGWSGQCPGSGQVSRDVVAACETAGDYSVSFWNKYGQISTLKCPLRVSGLAPVAILPSEPDPITISGLNQEVVLTASTCIGACYQWYLTRDGVTAPIEGANSPAYAVPISCDGLGIYTVRVSDRGWNFYEASKEVNSSGTVVSFVSTALHLAPANVGTGSWMYQWASSQYEDRDFEDLPGQTNDTLVVPNSSTGTRFYRVTAVRQGAIAVETVRVDDFPRQPLVYVLAEQNASLDVTYTAGSGPWAFQWYFRPGTGGDALPIAGATGNQYTISSVNCTTDGMYTVQGNCHAGGAAIALLYSCPP